MGLEFSAVQRILGILLMLFSLTMLPPAAVSLIYSDGAAEEFFIAFVLILMAGSLLFITVRDHTRELRLRDGFMVVVLFWVVLGVTGSIPFALAERPHLSLTDAVFESISGLTTTGSTVIVGLDSLPKSILYYRQQLQWLGGMGIIVLAVAVLPMLGIGGMQLYRAETPGPMKDSKLTPRIAETAKALWYIYLGLTVANTLAYWAAGMDLFDAVGHAFSTIAIGGFSTHDLSIGYFQSDLIELIAVVFMFLAGSISRCTSSPGDGATRSPTWRTRSSGSMPGCCCWCRPSPAFRSISPASTTTGSTPSARASSRRSPSVPRPASPRQITRRGPASSPSPCCSPVLSAAAPAPPVVASR